MADATKALRLADLLELDPSQWGGVAKVAWPAASVLRQQARRIAELEAANAVALEIAAQYVAERDELRARLEGAG